MRFSSKSEKSVRVEVEPCKQQSYERMSMTTKLEQLKKKQEQLRLQIQKEQQKESAKKRKEETRRKILLGAMVLERMDRDTE